MNIGERLKELRQTNNIKQYQLAQALNVHPTTITKYELGERTPDLKTICKIADYFDVSVDFLLGRTKY